MPSLVRGSLVPGQVALADRYFAGRAIGRRLTDARNVSLEIVEVIRDGSSISAQEPVVPTVFYLLAQSYTTRMTLSARTSGDAQARTDTVRRTLEAIRIGAAVFGTTTLAAHVAEALTADRLTAAMAGVSGLMALVLAIVGVYGVVAYGVVRRSREIGVRIAGSARPRDVVRLVVSEGVAVTLLGVGAGVVAALGATRFLASTLYGIAPWDAATFAGTGAILAAIAALAAWMPARRAVRLDPAVVLRQE